MNWSENGNQEIEPILPNEAETAKDETGSGLFFGDTGELNLDTRRVLVQLLSGPYLDGERHTKLWPVLLKDEGIIRRRLADLFLELEIDRDLQVAFTRQADTGDMEVQKLLRRSHLTFIDSVLLLYLRRQLAQAESHGGRAVVSKDEIVEYLNPYDRTGNTDKAGFTKRVHNSIDKIKDRRILQKIPGGEERFEVSPALKLLFSAEEILELTKLYRRMAEDESQADEDQSVEDEGEES